MANEKNLTPFTSEQSREEAVKNGRKGGHLWSYRSGEEAAKRVVSALELKPQRSPRNGGVLPLPEMMLELRANAEKCGGCHTYRSENEA